MRPSFELRLETEVDHVMAAARTRLPQLESQVFVQVAGHHVELLMAQECRHYWSPWLSVTIDDLRTEDGAGSRVRGRYGPHPSVWTMLMSIHIALMFSAVCGLVYGVAQWTLGRDPFALIAIPIAGLLMLGVYMVSLAGQRLGASQMHTLRDALDKLLALPPDASGSAVVSA
ncbi:MAG: hypothetical protein B7733_07425 [Myxococcales bacterium FL481]|nr:MAG: hypothetical protein B7733_07425 [Myxococcales bacterium FL481]